jgi:hypothetical protein
MTAMTPSKKTGGLPPGLVLNQLGEELMSTDLNRRALLAGAASLPAIVAAPAVAAEPDPIFALIAEHKRAYAVRAIALETIDDWDGDEVQAANEADWNAATNYSPHARPPWLAWPPCCGTCTSSRKSTGGRSGAAPMARGPRMNRAVCGRSYSIGTPQRRWRR